MTLARIIVGVVGILLAVAGCGNGSAKKATEASPQTGPKVVYVGREGDLDHFVSSADVFFDLKIGQPRELHKWEVRDLESFLPSVVARDFQRIRKSSGEWSGPQWRVYGANRFYGVMRLEPRYEVWTGYLVVQNYICELQMCLPRGESYRRVRQSMFDFTAGLPKTLPKEVLGSGPTPRN